MPELPKPIKAEQIAASKKAFEEAVDAIDKNIKYVCDKEGNKIERGIT